PGDTAQYSDTLLLKTDCFIAPLPIVGRGGTALIYATDIDFGNVVIGTTSCKPLTVKNIGSLPFVLTNNFFIQDSRFFLIAPGSAALLPLRLDPGDKGITLTFCYTPKSIGAEDSTTVDWRTDIPEPYTQYVKSYSLLNGKPVKPEVVWTTLTQSFNADSTIAGDTVVHRVYLKNKSGTTAEIDSIFVAGPTASEFSIIGNELGRNPIGKYPMQDADSLWFDVRFKPDLTKPYPMRYADRIDTLLALVTDLVHGGFDSAYIVLTATWARSGVALELGTSSFSVHPNPANGNTINVDFGTSLAQESTVSLYDILGNQLNYQRVRQGATETSIATGSLPNGMYYLRMSSGASIITRKIEIIR
ncbi:MAG: T9SS type A sorting domain-containing protein, partial [Ignavibacteriota bacterium]